MEMKIIDEQLEDKQQIITYKYLTEKLDIHPNKAKQLLKDYVSKLTDDKKYSTTIVIGGTLKENDEFCIVLAYDNHVETMRRRFKQINFEHLYSIQPVSRFDDTNNALYLVDNALSNYVNLSSSIKKKEKSNILLNEQSIGIAMEIDSSTNKEINITSNKVLNNINETIDETKVDKIQKKKMALDFFANNKKPEEAEIKIIPKKENSDFFTKFKKSNNSVNANSDSKKIVPVENIIIKDTEKMDVETPAKKLQENSTSEHETKTIKKSNKKKNNGEKSKNRNSQKVKRKRIQTFDSSDEEINSEEEDKKRSEHVMDVEDEVDFVQPTPPRPTPRENRKKEKQTTTSTFIDDDGFVCTSKEVQIVETECEPSESVSESKTINIEPANKKIKSRESDTAVQIEKKRNKNKPSKNSSSQGMKQSSLTSFFKAK